MSKWIDRVIKGQYGPLKSMCGEISYNVLKIFDDCGSPGGSSSLSDDNKIDLIMIRSCAEDIKSGIDSFKKEKMTEIKKEHYENINNFSDTMNRYTLKLADMYNNPKYENIRPLIDNLNKFNEKIQREIKLRRNDFRIDAGMGIKTR